MKVVFTNLKPDVWQYKVASTLKKNGIETTLISILAYNKDLFKGIFDEVICLGLPNLKPKSILKAFLKNPLCFFDFFFKLMTVKADGVICHGAPFWLTSFFIWLFKGKFPRIFFPYDWNSSMYKDVKKFIPKREFWGEKYSSLNCDAIIHKNSMEELEYLPKEFNIKEKPILHFSCYPLTEWCVDYKPKEKLSFKDKEEHIVYVGFFCHTAHQSMVSHVTEMLKQGLHVHLYTNDNLSEELISKIILDNKKLKNYLHMHKYVSPNKLSEEISKYDFGIHYSEFTENAHPAVEKVGFGNKRSSYFEALIPMISQKKLEFVSEDIKRHYLGIVIEDINDLKMLIGRFDYKKSIKNIKKFRKMTSVEKNIPRLIKFIKSLNEK